MMRTFTLAICLATIVAAVGPVEAATAKFSISVVQDSLVGISGAAVTVTPQGGSAISLTTDSKGSASCDVERSVAFTCAVAASGYLGCSFQKTLGANDDWGSAQVIMRKPRMGKSYLAQWRVGRTASSEDPAKDFARFNFYVKYYQDKSAVSGATIELSKGDGSVVNTLTTDAKGFATVLVAEGVALKVKITASGYADYTTGLAPGLKATARDVKVFLRKTI